MKNYIVYTLYLDGSYKWLRYPRTTKMRALRSHTLLVWEEEHRGNRVRTWFIEREVA